MAVNVTLSTVSSGYKASTINANFQAIKTALADAVSRSGSTPNTMSSNLDLNSNNLLNVGNIDAATFSVGGTQIDPDLLLSAVALAQAVVDAEAAEAGAQAAETGALAAQAAAEAAYDSFDDRYLGAKASDPTLDNDGNALLTGAIYFNTSSNEMKVYNGSSWLVLGPTDYVSDTGGTFTGEVVFSSTDNIQIPVGTTAQRPGSPSTGDLRFNSTNVAAEIYNGTSWTPVGGGGLFKGENGEVGTAPGDIFRINEQILNTNVTIDADENASTTGPLSIASGVTLTVTSGGTLRIL